MKLLASVVMVAALASSSVAQSPKPPAGDDAAIRAVADGYVKVTLAGDAKGIAALYTEDATEMPPNQPALKGRAAIQQVLRAGALPAVKFPRFSLNHLESHAVGDNGYERRHLQADLRAGRWRGGRRDGQVHRHPETIGRQLESRLRHLQHRSALARRGAVGSRAAIVVLVAQASRPEFTCVAYIAPA